MTTTAEAASSPSASAGPSTIFNTTYYHLLEQFKSSFRCSICQYTCVDPRSLPCGHFICTACAHLLVRNAASKETECPQCRQQFTDVRSTTVNPTIQQALHHLQQILALHTSSQASVDELDFLSQREDYGLQRRSSSITDPLSSSRVAATLQLHRNPPPPSTTFQPPTERRSKGRTTIAATSPELRQQTTYKRQKTVHSADDVVADGATDSQFASSVLFDLASLSSASSSPTSTPPTNTTATPTALDIDRCHVCYSNDTDSVDNLVLRCNTCVVRVHQQCYGVEAITDEFWQCQLCKDIPDRSKRGIVHCGVCPNTADRALKSVRPVSNPQQYVHIACAMTIPELYFHDADRREGVMNVQAISKSRRNMKCSVCQRRGAAIQCDYPRCAVSYHVPCARRQPGVMFDEQLNDNHELVVRTYCTKHSALRNAESIEEKENQPVATNVSASQPAGAAKRKRTASMPAAAAKASSQVTNSRRRKTTANATAAVARCVLLTSRLDDGQQAVVQELVDTMNRLYGSNTATLASAWAHSVTHLITSASSATEYLLQHRTMKYFLCLIAGQPVVTIDWVVESLALNRWMPVDARYLVAGDQHVLGGPSRSLRIAKEKPLFAGLTFVLAGQWSKPVVTHDIVEAVLMAGGSIDNVLPSAFGIDVQAASEVSRVIADVTKQSPKKQQCTSSGRYRTSTRWCVLYEAPRSDAVGEQIRQDITRVRSLDSSPLRGVQIDAVGSSWLWDCVSAYDLRPVDKS